MAGGILLTFGIAVLGLGLYSALPYFRGESCSMALMGLVLSLPVSVPAVVVGAVLLLVAWSRRRGSTPPGPG